MPAHIVPCAVWWATASESTMPTNRSSSVSGTVRFIRWLGIAESSTRDAEVSRNSGWPPTVVVLDEDDALHPARRPSSSITVFHFKTTTASPWVTSAEIPTIQGLPVRRLASGVKHRVVRGIEPRSALHRDRRCPDQSNDVWATDRRSAPPLAACGDFDSGSLVNARHVRG